MWYKTLEDQIPVDFILYIVCVCVRFYIYVAHGSSYSLQIVNKILLTCLLIYGYLIFKWFLLTEYDKLIQDHIETDV